MAEPYRRPAPGSHFGFYRMLRDGVYHTAGTVLALEKDQVDPNNQELVGNPADAEQVAALHGKVGEYASLLETMRADWESMKARVAEMEETIRGMQTPATPPPAPPTAQPEPPAEEPLPPQ